ncbi:MAG TPA: hypothetical protein VH165_09690 [Kofleriaceae bacterium]|nr:hypothetical protein [Kofleriaceae bacterium]
MTTLAIVSTDSLQTIDTVALTTITGGFDFGQAMQAGNTAAGPGREAGQTLGAGFDAGYKVVTGKDSTIGSTAGGPLGAAAGWAGGFATNSYQQLTGKR